MSDFATAIALDPVKQFSVFAENRVGRLYDLASVFQAHDVHIVALTVLDTTDSSILRFLVDDPDQARELEAEINIHYVYSFLIRPSEKNGLVINVEDPDVAAQALNNSGFRILTQADISR